MLQKRVVIAMSFLVAFLTPFIPQAIIAIHHTPTTSPFRLPIAAGLQVFVNQGNNDTQHDHLGKAAWAFDFIVGQTNFVVTATQGGTIIGANNSSTIQCSDINTEIAPAQKFLQNCWTYANYVLIANDDGTTAALYLHFLPYSLKVSPRMHVNQGDSLGLAGTTGWSSGVHLHFQVENMPSAFAQQNQPAGWWWTQSVPVSFTNPEVRAQDSNGVPIEGQSFVVSKPPQSTPVSTTPTPLCSTPSGTNYFDDFSSYAPGQPPSGYTLRGASGVNPTIEEVGGTGPAYRLLDFPAVSNQYWDRWVLKTRLTLCTSYIVTVKLNFQASGDRAGLAIAWNDNNLDRIDIQPNIYFQNIEFRITYTGSTPTSPSVTGPALNHNSLSMNIGSYYWLRVVATSSQPGQDHVIVYWSTDGTNFTPEVIATGLANITGLAGMSTSGPNLPNVYFDDFQAHEN